MSNTPTLIFTGGHHTSALVVANLLKKNGWNIIWIGHKYSMWGDSSPSAEYREVTESGIEFIELRAGKLHNTYNPQKLLRVPFGFFQSFQILKKIKSTHKDGLKGIISFGGYLGVPVVFCGWMLGLPTVSHEQTTVAGWANKFISLFAQKIAVTWPRSLELYPKSKTELTGLPLREEILSELKRLPEREKKIYITGGKQGSHIINQTIFSILGDLLNQFQVVHQTGSSTLYADYAEALKIKAALDEKQKNKYRVFEYLDAKSAAHNISTAQIVVGRSGAHITYELAVTGTRSVLIPIPWSSHNEQLNNAQVLRDKNLAVVVQQSDLNGRTLMESINKAGQLKVSELQLPLDGAERMVHLIEEVFKK
jgi:UDP-N-acetylglucosamine--N-acetylmuramyl-(pentapeptide) pyrophosphoryl-undecaprenol N-acetylglucosamine transferase